MGLELITVSISTRMIRSSSKIKIERAYHFFRETKASFYKTNLENCTNNKDGWKYINELLNRKSHTTTINELKAGERTITGNQNKVNEFNKFFCEIGPRLQRHTTE